MKINYVQLVLSVLLALFVASKKSHKSHKSKVCRARKYELSDMCRTKSTCYDKSNSCPCFCSYKGGPRDKKPEDVSSFLEGICFCADRDVEIRQKWKDLLDPYRNYEG